MSKSKYLSVDFGAESGRSIVGMLENNRLELEEIHRFPNPQINVHGRLHWDVLFLFEQLKKGLAAAVEKGHQDIRSIGIDTWGVDFGFIDKTGQVVGNPVCYRDDRTNGMMERAFEKMPKKEIYQHTGIQFMQLNTIFQLLSLVEEDNPQLQIADKLLFMPDLFAYLLTGNKVAEYSIASTSQLLDAHSKTWASKIFNQLEIPQNLMPPIANTGTLIGPLLEDIASEVGLGNVNVVAPAGHDTACAVAAVPAQMENWAYLSSGTWSLLGVENNEPIINDHSFENGFTNEGGVNGKIRFLRNIMGMWLLEKSRQVWVRNGLSADYDNLLKQAADAKPFKSIINPDDNIFLNPPDMPQAIAEYCRKTRQPVPENSGEYVRSIFESLALKYRFVVEMINSMRPAKIEVLHVVGGGSKNKILNQFIANSLGIPVIAGPVEATAIGNILMQAITNGEIENIAAGRKLVAASFSLETFEPEAHTSWEDQYQKSKGLFL